MVVYPVFVILDDRTLSVYDALKDIQRDLEAIDIHAGEYEFHDGLGNRLHPILTAPDSTTFMSMTITGGGELTGFESTKEDSLLDRLSGVSAINPNPHFSDVSAVAIHLKR